MSPVPPMTTLFIGFALPGQCSTDDLPLPDGVLQRLDMDRELDVIADHDPVAERHAEVDCRARPVDLILHEVGNGGIDKPGGLPRASRGSRHTGKAATVPPPRFVMNTVRSYPSRSSYGLLVR